MTDLQIDPAPILKRLGLDPEHYFITILRSEEAGGIRIQIEPRIVVVGFIKNSALVGKTSKEVNAAFQKEFEAMFKNLAVLLNKTYGRFAK